MPTKKATVKTVAIKKGGANTPKAGEQGFQKSKAGKVAPTAGTTSRTTVATVETQEPKFIFTLNNKYKIIQMRISKDNDAPCYRQPVVNKFADAAFGYSNYIFKQLLEVDELTMLKVLQAYHKENDRAHDKQFDAEERIWTIAYDSMLVWGRKWDKEKPDAEDNYLNGYYWESLWGYGHTVASALKARSKGSKEDYDELTTAWRTFVGAIHPDDEDVFVGV